MSNAYNHVTIIGNLCNEPEFATTQSGISRVNFRVGVQRRFNIAVLAHLAKHLMKKFLAPLCFARAGCIVVV